MESSEEIVLGLVKKILGDSKTHVVNPNKPWMSFNCVTPTCKKDKNKFNLAYSLIEKKLKCWKCDYRASIYDFVQQYGTDEEMERLNFIMPKHLLLPSDIIPKFDKEKNYDSITCELPEEYLPLSIERGTKLYKLAWNYVTKTRKFTLAQIDKFKIGYAETGRCKFRIILPSLNVNGDTNYYEARSFLKSPHMTYLKNKDIKPSEIIFDEYYINWDLPTYLTEGVFDAKRLPNAIPLLGKIPSDLLIYKLIKHKCTVIICLDADAMHKGIEIYKKLQSLGLDMYFIDLKEYKDISKIYEDFGNEKLIEVIKDIKKIDVLFEFDKLLKLC